MTKYVIFSILTVVLLGLYCGLLGYHFSDKSLDVYGEFFLLLLLPVVAFATHQYGFWTGRVSRRFLRKVIDAVPSMIFVKDRHGRFQLGNQAVADIYGTTVAEIVNKTDRDFNKDLKEIDHFVNDDLDVITKFQDKFIPEEAVTDCNGITRYYQTVKRPLRFVPGGEVHVLGVATDVTETKRLQQELMQSHKMEAIGQLAGGIAHDFNNLLTAILGHAELLRIHGKTMPEVLRSADLIEAAANQAAQLTAKLLAFARKGKHENIAVDVHKVIRETKILLERTMSGHAAVVECLDAEESCVLGDPVQIQQVIMNLAINARDAIRQKWRDDAVGEGEIRIATRTRTREESADFEDLPLEGDSFIEVSVGDNGCGIAQNNLTKVFEPFYTTKEQGKGTGMGLPMVFGIVKSHGGGIVLNSKEGEGTVVRVLLPVLRGAASEAEEGEEVGLLRGSGKILVVDDSSEALETTSSMLSALGYEVIAAKDGADAMRGFEGNKDVIELAVLDCLMPKMGGKECLKVLRKSKPGLKVIMASGAGSEDLEGFSEEDNVTFLPKPFHLEQLSKAVSHALASSSGRIIS